MKNLHQTYQKMDENDPYWIEQAQIEDIFMGSIQAKRAELKEKKRQAKNSKKKYQQHKRYLAYLQKKGESNGYVRKKCIY